MLLLESKLDDQGETFYINGNVFYTKNLTLCKQYNYCKELAD